MFVSQKSESDPNKMLNQAALEAMHSAVYIEDYLDFVENIPDDIQRNLTQLRELDLKYQEILQDLDNFQNTLTRDLDPISRKRTLLQVQRALIQTQDLGDKKLQIVQVIQDIIDNKGRQLEIDRMKLDLGRENEAQNDNTKNEPPERPTKRSRRQRHTDLSLRDDSIHERQEKEVAPAPSTSKTKKKKKRKTKVEKEPEAPTLEPPIDPDEPTYCLCDQVSYGEMIGCDNEDCEREWFHFSCVGLTTKPKGKWYCPTCRGDRSNQMKPKNL
ncbi:inhibitor of growth protein 1 [Parasteatoda tepidariorum]|uniref:inhibitor of growth protein 1 n=1 Tax=Parasteatoda tepidariorum TaxID=114398 RepID=UPI00077F9F20|nr:inhibitor of growth protein 1 isoform X1 [Parasteatoda tepidariorum]XP_042902821.1 inhibitor of growth protein 1 isoform X2 [Parasteatoda tepidariorum]